MVIGVTDEAEGLVDRWVEENEPGFPIVILANSSVEDAIGVQFFPTAAVVGPDGVITYSGSAGAYSKSLKEALAGAEKGSLIPKALSKVEDALKENDHAGAYEEVVEELEGGKLEGRELAWARKLKDWLEGLAVDDLAAGRALVEEGYLFRAFMKLDPYREIDAAYPNRGEIVAFLEELEGRDEFQAEMKGGELFEEVDELMREWEFVKAIKVCRKVYKKYPDSQIALKARAFAEEVVAEGLPGAKPTCDKCRRKRRACSKHEESVRL